MAFLKAYDRVMNTFTDLVEAVVSNQPYHRGWLIGAAIKCIILNKHILPSCNYILTHMLVTRIKFVDFR